MVLKEGANPNIHMEKKRRPMVNYIEKIQNDVTITMRGILVDWLVEVAEEYELLSDTLRLSVSYVDKVLSINPVSKPMLQLLGVSKYEENSPPHVEEFSFITDNTYCKAEVVCMEAEVLKALNFELGNPTVKTFSRRFTGIACENRKICKLLFVLLYFQASSLQFEFMSYYLAELSLLDYYCLKL
ncbi:putative cyclin-A3-1, partial [Mucuna pruriens]